MSDVTPVERPPKGLKLSAHFSYDEMTTTQVRGVSNEPPPEQLINMGFLCRRVLEPVRLEFGPWHVTSGYRSLAVNLAIGGSKTSAHMEGCAVDGVPLAPGVRWRDVVDFLLRREDIPVDQVIYEFGRWLHIGTKPGGKGCRREALMIFEPGKYLPWNPEDPRVTR